MKLKILFLVFIEFLSSMMTYAYDAVIDGIYYNILSEMDNTVEVTYEKSPSLGFYSGDIIIPEKVEYNNKTYTVTSIGYGAFSSCSSLQNVTIPNTITSIKAWAFNECSKITEITIPKSVVSIGYSAFYGCYGLNKLTIEDSNEKLIFEVANTYSLESAFESVPLNNIYLGRDISYSLRSPFFRNNKISSVTIGKKVTTINDAMFIGCRNIQEILIPSSINYIGNNAFSDCTGLKTLVFEDGINELTISSNPNNWGPFYWCMIDSLYLGRNIIAEEGRKTSDIFMGANVSSIFTGESVSNIPDRLFCYCSELKKVYLNKNIEKIGIQTFSGTFIRDVYCYSTDVIPIERDAFFNLSNDSAVLHVPYVALPFYQSDNGWSIFKTIKSIEKTYTLSYYINGEFSQSYDLLEGMTIPIPEKEGYTFYSWSDIPETMPAHDVTVTGTFSINKYKLTYMVDGTEYKIYEVEYGATITPEAAPTKEGYTFSGWSEIPETMPAHDVVVHASYTSGIIEVIMTEQRNVRIYSPNGKKHNKLQKGLNIIILNNGTAKKVIMK